MTRLLDQSKPLIPQLRGEIEREVELSKPAYLVVGLKKIELAKDFVFSDLKTIVVLINEEETDKERLNKIKDDLRELGTIPLIGFDRKMDFFHSASKQYRTLFPVEVMAATMRELSLSTKYTIGLAAYAVDQAVVEAGVSLIAVGGVGDEPDTALLLEPQPSKKIIDTHIIKLICEPYRQGL